MARKYQASRKMTAQTGNRQGQAPARMVGFFAKRSTVSKKRVIGKEAVMVLKWALSGDHGRSPLRQFLLVLAFLHLGFLWAEAANAALPANLGQQQQQYRQLRHVPLANVNQAPPSREEVAAAKGMEQLFVEQMVQELRKSVPDSDLIPVSNGERIYRQMLDTEYSRMMTDSYDFGIADLVLAEIRGKK